MLDDMTTNIYILFIRILVGLVVCFFLPACSKSHLPDEATIRSRLVAVVDLASTEYHVRKVILVNDERIYGDRKILFEAFATVKAGIDFERIKINEINNELISLTIPDPKIIVLNIPPDKIKELRNESDAFRSKFTDMEKDKILQLGERDIKSKIYKTGILKEAKKNAEIFIGSWLKLMGFKTVTIL